MVGSFVQFLLFTRCEGSLNSLVRNRFFFIDHYSIVRPNQGRSKLDNWGGGLIFIYMCSHTIKIGTHSVHVGSL